MCGTGYIIYSAGDITLMEQDWNGLFGMFYMYLSGNITSMEQVEQVEQVNTVSMKIHNSFVMVLCFKNMLQKVLC